MIGQGEIRALVGAPETKEVPFLLQLQRVYPDLKDRLDSLVDASEEGDDQDVQEAIRALLTYLTDEMNEAYPQLSKAERALASEKIGKNIREGRWPRKQAIAIGLRQGAPSKYRSFEKRRRREMRGGK